MRYLSIKNRSILREMVSADFKIRYQGSILGYLWSVLRPLFMFAILYVVFTFVFNVGKGIEHYPVYLLLGIVLWNFFTESTITGMGAVVGKGDLIRKISIPRYLTVLSSSMSALINLGINLCVVMALALINGVDFTWRLALILPILLELLALSTAVAFFLSALFVKFRDVTYVWEVLMQAAFYLTPIIYPIQKVTESYHKYFFINPITQIIQDARYALVSQKYTITIWNTLSFPYTLAPILVIVILVILSRSYFRNQAKWFAENI